MHRRIYIDMDGVLTDFDAAATILEKTTGFVRTMGGFWDIVGDIADIFYSRLKPIDEIKDLIYMLKRYNYNLNVISKVPYNCKNAAMIGKTQWLDKWYRQNVFNDVIFVPTYNSKSFYCKDHDILIDDDERNIRDWGEQRGHGLIYRRGDIKDLENRLMYIIDGNQPICYYNKVK